MIDFGFDKIALIGAVARIVGHLLGKAQRYVADVKAEVSRSIELDELKKMKTEFEGAARDVEQSVSREVNAATSDLERSWSGDGVTPDQLSAPSQGMDTLLPPPLEYKP